MLETDDRMKKSALAFTDQKHAKKRGRRRQRDADPASNVDFALIQCVARLVLRVLVQCWALSAAAVLAVFLLYCMYGGWLALSFLAFAVAGVIYHAGDWILYHPEQPPHSRLYVPSPHTFGLSFENLFLRTKDGVRINAFLIKHPPTDAVPSRPTVVYLHGNAGNIGHRLVNAKGLYENLGCDVLMLEYRGFGRSDGTPSEEGLYWDVRAGVDHLLSRTDVDREKIVVFGRSLGGAVAIDLASDPHYCHSVSALLVENSFTSIPDMAQIFLNFRLVKAFPSWFYKNKFLSKKKVRFAKLPTLFISGLADKLIPPRMMQELYSLSGSTTKGLVTFESGTHNETWQCDGYYETLGAFLTKALNAGVRPAADEGPAEDFCIQIPASIA